MKKRIFIYLLFFLSIVFQTHAQSSGAKPVVTDIATEVTSDSLIVPAEFSGSLDLLLHSWAVDKDNVSECSSSPNPSTSDEQYKARLMKLPHVIEMPFNQEVKSFIEIYTQKNRKGLEYMLD